MAVRQFLVAGPDLLEGEAFRLALEPEGTVHHLLLAALQEDRAGDAFAHVVGADRHGQLGAGLAFAPEAGGGADVHGHRGDLDKLGREADIEGGNHVGTFLLGRDTGEVEGRLGGVRAEELAGKTQRHTLRRLELAAHAVRRSQDDVGLDADL